MAEDKSGYEIALERIAAVRESMGTDEEIYKLDLSSLGLKFIPQEISNLTKLNKLYLSLNQISKIENLDKLFSLRELYLDYNQISIIENLNNLTALNVLFLNDNRIHKIENLHGLIKLKDLCLYNNYIVKIENLEVLVNLNELYLFNNQIKKIENLEKLTKLVKLSLNFNQISKIENLQALINLNVLYLHNNQIKKIENLEKLIKLDALSLYENQIKKIENLDNLNELTLLQLEYNQVEKIENLENLINLTLLDLGYNKIIRIENLEKLINLTSLNLECNYIEKIEGLNNLLALKILSISFNKINKLEGLNSLLNLKDLVVFGNRIGKIEGLDLLTNLEYINLSNNLITRLEGLSKLLNLFELVLASNNIEKIEGLEALVNLKTLNLYDNTISKLEGLDCLYNLEHLVLSQNRIATVESLKNLKNLIELNLDSNLIKEIPSFETLTNIKEFYFYNNQIESFPKEFIESIKDMKNIKIHIHENPFLVNSGVSKSDYSYEDDDTTNHFYQLLRDYASIMLRTDIVEIEIPTKIALFGNSNAGKSHLREFLLKDSVSGEVKSTPTLEIHHWLEESNEINVNIYDFGGQDFFHAIYQMFFTLDTFYLIIWDHKTNRNQINQERVDSRAHDYFEFDVSFWLGNIEYGLNRVRTENQQHSETHIFLLRNKIDMDEQLHNEIIKNSKIKFHKAQVNFLIDHTFDIYLLDNDSNFSRYRTFFKERLLYTINSKKLNKSTSRIRKIYISKILKICNDSNQVLEMGYGTLYNELGRNSIETHKIDFESSLRILRDSGLILWYEFEDSLKHIIWLSPQNVASRIHDLLQESSKEGFILEKDYEKKFGNLKQILVQQHISFYDENFFKGPSYIIPQYLPAENTNDPLFQIAKGGLNHVFSIQCIDFMPFGIFNRIAAYFGGNPDQKYYVKNKIIFTIDKVKIWIEVDPILFIIYVKWSRPSDTKADQLKSYLFRTIITAYWNGLFRKYGEHEIDQIKIVGEIKPTSVEQRVALKKLAEQRKISQKRTDFNNSKTKWDFYQDLKDKKNLLKKFRLSIDSEALYYSDYLDIVNASENPLENPYVDAFYLNLDKNKPLKKQHQLHLYNPFLDRTIKSPLKIFLSYAHEDFKIKERVLTYLKPLIRENKVEIWHDSMIRPGDSWDDEIQNSLEQCDIYLLLISPDSIASDYIIFKELQLAYQKNKKILGFLLSECDWYSIVFRVETDQKVKLSNIQIFPKKTTSAQTEKTEDVAVPELLSLELFPHQSAAFIQIVNELKIIYDKY